VISDDQVLVAANWLLRDSPCDEGRIGAAIYDVNLDSGAVEIVSLPSGTGPGASRNGELVVLPGFMGAGSFLFSAPTDDISSVETVAIGGVAGSLLSSNDRILVLVPATPEILVRGSAGQFSIALAGEPRAFTRAFERVWVSGGTGVEMFAADSLALLGTNAACESDGPIAAVGDVVAVQCAAGGLLALSSTGGDTAITLSPASQILGAAGNEGSPFGFLAFTGNDTTAFSFDQGLLGDAFPGFIDDAPVFLSSSMALVITNGLTRRVSFPTGAMTAAFASARSGGAQMDLTPGGNLVVAQGGESRSLDVHVLDPATGDPIRPPIALPSPSPFFIEE